MTYSKRRMCLAVVITGVWLTTSSVAVDLDALMRQFRVTPIELKPAPAFSLKTLDGKTAALEDYRGRAVLLYFWATW